MQTWRSMWSFFVLTVAAVGLMGCAQSSEPVVETVAEVVLPEEEVIEPEEVVEEAPAVEEVEEEIDYKYVALTFDDGPVPNTEYLLDGLAERGVKATFFCLGIQAVKYPDTIQRIVDDGHQLANHSTSHLNMTKVDEAVWQADFQAAEDTFNAILGLEDATYWLRPPYGLINRSQYSKIDVPMVLWTVDPYDWELLDKDAVLEALLATVDPFEIVLLHDTHITSVEAALELIDILVEEDYCFVTVEQLLELGEIEAEPGVIYRAATGGNDTIWYGS